MLNPQVSSAAPVFQAPPSMHLTCVCVGDDSVMVSVVYGIMVVIVICELCHGSRKVRWNADILNRGRPHGHYGSGGDIPVSGDGAKERIWRPPGSIL